MAPSAVQREDSTDDLAPGWDAIEERFAAIYPDQKPLHLATDFSTRAVFGGDEYLDGCSVYTSPKGYSHLVTFGLSELYEETPSEEPPSEDAQVSGWGYEMTVKWMRREGDDREVAMWAGAIMSKLALYTNTQGRTFEPLQCVGRGMSADLEDSNIDSFMVVRDTEVPTIETIHGRVEFMQFIGITREEFTACTADRSLRAVLVERLKEDYPDLAIDLSRTKNYI